MIGSGRNNSSVERIFKPSQHGKVVIHYKNLCAITQGGSCGIFPGNAGTQNSDGCRRYSRYSTQHNSLTVASVFKIVRGNLNGHGAGDLMHHSYNGKFLIITFNEFIADTADAFINQSVHERMSGMAEMEG